MGFNMHLLSWSNNMFVCFTEADKTLERWGFLVQSFLTYVDINITTLPGCKGYQDFTKYFSPYWLVVITMVMFAAVNNDLYLVSCLAVQMQMHTLCNGDLSLLLIHSLPYLSLCLCLCQTSSETHCSAGNALTIQTAGLYTLDLTL